MVAPVGVWRHTRILTELGSVPLEDPVLLVELKHLVPSGQSQLRELQLRRCWVVFWWSRCGEPGWSGLWSCCRRTEEVDTVHTGGLAPHTQKALVGLCCGGSGRFVQKVQSEAGFLPGSSQVPPRFL